MVIYLFGSRFSLAVHGHIEFADLIKNRWYNLAGNVYIILNKMSQMQFRMMIEHVSELGHHFYTKKKKTPTFSSSFNLVCINWNTVHKIIIRLNDKKIPRKRGLEAE